MFGGYLSDYLLFLFSWFVIGQAIFSGHVERGLLWGWVLVLGSAVIVHTATLWQQHRVVISAATLLQKRLLSGVLRSSLGRIRQHGVGDLMARVSESDALERMSISGGLLVLEAALQLLVVPMVLWQGAQGGALLIAFVVSVVGCLWLARHLMVATAAYCSARIDVGQRVVDQMVGQRTWRISPPSNRWHDANDSSLTRYLETVQRADRWRIVLLLVPRLWLVCGLCVTWPGVLDNTTVGRLATAVGGILLGQLVLSRLVQGVSALGQAAIAWQQVEGLFEASAQRPSVGRANIALSATPAEAETTADRSLVEANGVCFAYGQDAPVLDGANFHVSAGDHWLLVGASGEGKSTLAKVLAGLEEPNSGVVWSRGYDPASLGQSGWRRRVILTAQFHENYVLTESLLFNVLLGSDWPPSPESVRDALTLCSALRLDRLLESMPAGAMQMVGETGWHLSHGERSRVYLARALLQRPDVVVLDESFAALDPPTLRHCVGVAREWSNGLVVIAHP